MSIRPLLATTFAVAGLLCAQEAAPQPAEFTVATGTKVPLSLINSVSTKHSAEGDRVYLESVFPVLVNGRIVVPVGSYVAGTVTQLKKPGRVKGRGELYVRFDSLTLPNGVTRDFHGRIGSMDGNAKDELDRAEGKVRSEGNKSGDARTVGEATRRGRQHRNHRGRRGRALWHGRGHRRRSRCRRRHDRRIVFARSGRGPGAGNHAGDGARPADQLHRERIEFRQLPGPPSRHRGHTGRHRRRTLHPPPSPPPAVVVGQAGSLAGSLRPIGNRPSERSSDTGPLQYSPKNSQNLRSQFQPHARSHQ